jgi:hypothetical protein
VAIVAVLAVAFAIGPTVERWFITALANIRTAAASTDKDTVIIVLLVMILGTLWAKR